MSTASAAYIQTFREFQQAVQSTASTLPDQSIPVRPTNQSGELATEAESPELELAADANQTACRSVKWEELHKKLGACWRPMLSWLCRMKADGKSQDGIGKTSVR